MGGEMVKYKSVPLEFLFRIKSQYDIILIALDTDADMRKTVERFRFSPPELPFVPKSILIAAQASPLAMLDFDGLLALMPPIYYEFGSFEDKFADMCKEKYPTSQFAVGENIPKKALAVAAGLAQYGRNHISYIDGLGSFFDIAVLFSDREPEDTTFFKSKRMDCCEDCGKCIANCPTEAIGDNALRVSRCITHYNENPNAIFPAWLPRAAHNAIIGCMRCQSCCPANAEVLAKQHPRVRFTKEETQAFLAGGKLPKEMHEKLASVHLEYDDYIRNVFPRNLKLLMAASDIDN